MKNIVKFKNGITLISQQQENTHSVSISVNFRTGSLYENNNNNGITHLVEHLFFRKWDDLPQSELYFEMMSLGAEIIGKTYNDYVSFSITVVPKFFIKAFNLITKCLNKFYWNEDDIISEKKVVCKQIENYYQSYQSWINYNYFKGTSYEYPIMGTLESLQKLSIKDINIWKDTYFCSNNACIAIVGNYKKNEFLVVQEKIAQISNIGKSTNMIISPPKNFNSRNRDNRYTIISDNSENTDITIFFDIQSTFDYEIIRLLSAILGEGCGSVLSMALKETMGFTDDIYTDLMCFCGFYRLSLSFDISNSDFFDCISLIFDTISKFKSNISQNDFLSFINFFTNNQIIDLDNPKALNNRYVLSDFVLNPIPSEPFELKKRYERISISDLQSYANRILNSNNISFLVQTSINSEKVIEHLERSIDRTLKTT